MTGHTLYERDFISRYPFPIHSVNAAGQDLVLALRFALQNTMDGRLRP